MYLYLEKRMLIPSPDMGGGCFLEGEDIRRRA
jgi:hypothetical protein